MRRQDELLVLYPVQDVFNRKFILSELDGLSRTFDSEDVLDLLRGELAAPQRLLAHQAYASLVLFLPGFIRRTYGVDEPLEGLWTRYRDIPRVAPQDRLETGGETDEGLRARLLELTRPVVEALLSLLDHADPRTRRTVRLCLAQFPFADVTTELNDRFDRNPDDLDLLLSFVRSGGSLRSEEALLAAIHRSRRRCPDTVLALIGASPGTASRFLLDQAAGLTGLGRANAAIVLSKMDAPSSLPVLRALLARRESWVDVYSLRAIENLGSPDLLAEVVEVHERSPHDFVRAQAVRAAGGLPGASSIDFCLAAASAPQAAIHAQALESLVRLRCPVESLRAAAAPLEASPSLKARVHALLALMDPGDRRFPRGLHDLVQDPRPLVRLEGAYCLGYWQSETSLRCLGAMASRDPDLPVRLQALKSLSRYPASHAVRILLPAMGAPCEPLARTASRVVTRYRGEEGRITVEAILDRLAGTEGDRRAVLLRALGSLAGESGSPGSEKALREGLGHHDPRVVLGALEGWKGYGPAREVEVGDLLEPLCRSDDPRLRHRALFASVIQGSASSIAAVGSSLARADDAARGWALQAVLELGLVWSEVLVEPRYGPLARRLADTIPGSMPAGSIGRCWRPMEPDAEYRPELGPGEFEVHQNDLGPARVLDEEAWSSPGPEAGSEKAPVQATFQREVARQTHLLGRRLTPRDLELEAWASEWPVPIRTALGALGWRGAVAIPVLLALVIGLSSAGTGPSPTLPPPLPPAAVLTIVRVEGAARAMPGDSALVPGDEIRTGQTIECPGGVGVRSRSPMGDRVDIGPGGRLSVVAVSDDGGRLLLDVGPGSYDLDFSSRQTAVLQVGDRRIGGTRMHLRLSWSRGEIIVESLRGVVRLQEQDGTMRDLPAREVLRAG